MKTFRTELTDEQYVCIEMMIAGMSQKEIAKTINVNEVTISRWKRLDYFMEARREMYLDKFIDVIPKAQAVILKSLSSDKEELALKAAMDLLDRGGIKAPDKREIKVEATTMQDRLNSMSDEELEERAKRLNGDVQ